MSNFWSWLNGKKRTIAEIYWAIWIPALVIFWPDAVPESVEKTTAFIGLVLTYVGLGHSGVKAMTKKQGD